MYVFAIFFSFVHLMTAHAEDPSAPTDEDILMQSLTGESAQSTIPFKGYNVDGSYDSFLSSSCHYENIKKIIRESSHSTQDLGRHLQKWAKNCSKELSRNNSSALSSLLNFNRVQYSFALNKKIKRVDFSYDKGRLKTKALLIFKDKQKRPLVVIRNGVNGDAAETASVKNFIMQLSDESPFHVVFLGNLTGTEFLKQNHVVSMGGFDEGRQYHEIIKQLISPSSPYHNLIEDVHIMGISLAGNGALMSSIYNSFLSPGQNKVKSVMALCPVTHLQNSYKHIFSESPVGYIGSLATHILVRKLYPELPGLWPFLEDKKFWTTKELSLGIKQSAVEYYKNRTRISGWDYAPFLGLQVQSEEDFWDLNDISLFAHYIRTPTLVVHAKDDPIVKSSENSDLLFQKNTNPHLGSVQFATGSHCAFNIANGWPTISSLLREFVLKHSSYVPPQEQTLPIFYKEPPKAPLSQLFAGYQWRAEKNKSQAQLKISYFDKWALDKTTHQLCSRQDYRFANISYCYRTRTFLVPLGSLKAQVPNSEFEANLTERWLNTHVSPLSQQKELLYGLAEIPAHFKVEDL